MRNGNNNKLLSQMNPGLEQSQVVIQILTNDSTQVGSFALVTESSPNHKMSAQVQVQVIVSNIILFHFHILKENLVNFILHH